MTFVVLLRGINVGGKNKVPMAGLRTFLQDAGFTNVRTYIQSGNALLDSTQPPAAVRQAIEEGLPKAFALDSALVKVLVLTHDELAGIVADAPDGFGTEPDTYHYDVCFFMGEVTSDDVMARVSLHPQVDTAVAGDRALYFRRLSALRTRSRMSVLISTPVYQSLTIRNWNTTTKLLAMLDEQVGRSREPDA